MKAVTSYDQLDKLRRVRLSQNFYMRDFLFSEIAAWHAGSTVDGTFLQLRNVPDRPDVAIEAGKQLCNLLLEPLQATFGRINIRSGWQVTPERVIRSTVAPQKLTAPDMSNHGGLHASEYPGYPELRSPA